VQAVEPVGREVDRDALIPQPVGDLFGQQYLVPTSSTRTRVSSSTGSLRGRA
jgi:hypothetical protein